MFSSQKALQRFSKSFTIFCIKTIAKVNTIKNGQITSSSMLPKSCKTVNGKCEVRHKIREAKKTNEKMSYFCHHTCLSGLFDINARQLGILKG